jgi:hypothetical protein
MLLDENATQRNKSLSKDEKRKQRVSILARINAIEFPETDAWVHSTSSVAAVGTPDEASSAAAAAATTTITSSGHDEKKGGAAGATSSTSSAAAASSAGPKLADRDTATDLQFKCGTFKLDINPANEGWIDTANARAVAAAEKENSAYVPNGHPLSGVHLAMSKLYGAITHALIAVLMTQCDEQPLGKHDDCKENPMLWTAAWGQREAALLALLHKASAIVVVHAKWACRLLSDAVGLHGRVNLGTTGEVFWDSFSFTPLQRLYEQLSASHVIESRELLHEHAKRERGIQRKTDLRGNGMIAESSLSKHDACRHSLEDLIKVIHLLLCDARCNRPGVALGVHVRHRLVQHDGKASHERKASLSDPKVHFEAQVLQATYNSSNGMMEVDRSFPARPLSVDMHACASDLLGADKMPTNVAAWLDFAGDMFAVARWVTLFPYWECHSSVHEQRHGMPATVLTNNDSNDNDSNDNDNDKSDEKKKKPTNKKKKNKGLRLNTALWDVDAHQRRDLPLLKDALASRGFGAVALPPPSPWFLQHVLTRCSTVSFAQKLSTIVAVKLNAPQFAERHRTELYALQQCVGLPRLCQLVDFINCRDGAALVTKAYEPVPYAALRGSSSSSTSSISDALMHFVTGLARALHVLHANARLASCDLKPDALMLEPSTLSTAQASTLITAKQQQQQQQQQEQQQQQVKNATVVIVDLNLAEPAHAPIASAFRGTHGFCFDGSARLISSAWQWDLAAFAGIVGWLLRLPGFGHGGTTARAARRTVAEQLQVQSTPCDPKRQALLRFCASLFAAADAKASAMLANPCALLEDALAASSASASSSASSSSSSSSSLALQKAAQPVPSQGKTEAKQLSV